MGLGQSDSFWTATSVGGALTEEDLERAMAAVRDTPIDLSCPHTRVPIPPSLAEKIDGHPCLLCGVILRAP